MSPGASGSFSSPRCRREWELYAYVNNDPLNEIDPSGRVAIVDDALEGGVLVIGCAITPACRGAVANAFQSAGSAIASIFNTAPPLPPKSWVGRGRGGECSAKLAGYLSKYITKSINDHVEYVHRYRRSHNITVEETIEEFDDADLERVAVAVFQRVTVLDPRFVLRGSTAGECFIWACSWGGIPGAAERVPR
jgi:hypothetical protein